MPDISFILNKTTNAIDAWYERNNRVSYNKYLAMSDLGEACSRKLWYKFRNYLPKEAVAGRIQRIFETGQEQENRVIKALQGIALVGNCQARVSACDDHLQGAIDGEILGLSEAPQTTHLLEIKSHNEKNFRELEKEGVEKGFFKHFVQFQIYGYLRKLERYFYIAINKNDEAIYQERGEINPVFAQAQIQRAERIIRSEVAPERIGKEDSFECKWCYFAGICHRGDKWHVGIRNDGTHRPGPNGEWVKV